jgi:hypothetical protein
MSGSSEIYVGNYTLVVSGTANFESITVNADNFTIDLPKNASLTVTSSDRRSYTTSPTAYVQSFTCGSDSSTMTLGNNVWDQTITVTVTPSTSVCSATTGGGIVGGGGGGGGGGNIPTPVQTTIPGTQVAQGTITPPTTSAVSAGGVSVVFTKPLVVGTINSDVKRLQQLLNSDSATKVAASGAGSPGKETNYFGPATTKAVQKFQCKYNIVCSGTPKTTGYGNLGPKTRTKIQAVFGK